MSAFPHEITIDSSVVHKVTKREGVVKHFNSATEGSQTEVWVVWNPRAVIERMPWDKREEWIRLEYLEAW